MSDLRSNIAEALSDFRQIAALAHAEFLSDTITVELSESPHRPPSSLPSGKQAVYAYFWNGQALKVGKVGPKSTARYTSQHYNPRSAQSTLAGSRHNNPGKIGLQSLDIDEAGAWIKQHTGRVNLLIPANLGVAP